MRRIRNHIRTGNDFKTPEKKQPVPRDYSAGKKPLMNFNLIEEPLPVLKLFWKQTWGRF